MNQKNLNTCLSLLLTDPDADQGLSNLTAQELDDLLMSEDFHHTLISQTLISDALTQHLPNHYDSHFSTQVMQKIQQEVASNIQVDNKHIESVPLINIANKTAKNDAFYKKASVWASAVFVLLVVNIWLFTSIQQTPEKLADIKEQAPVIINSPVQQDIAKVETVESKENTPQIPLQIANSQAPDMQKKLDQPLPEGEWEKRLGIYLDRYREETGNSIIPYTRPANYSK